MPIPQNSKIYDVGIFPTTRTITSMKSRIYSKPFGSTGETLMAAVSSFSGGGSSKSVEEIKGIGMGDIILDLAAGETTIDDISISRAAFFGDNLLQALGFAGGVDGLLRTLQGVRYPLDLKQQILGFAIHKAYTPNGGEATIQEWYDDPAVEYDWAKNKDLATREKASYAFYDAYSGKTPLTDGYKLTSTTGEDGSMKISVLNYVFENCWITNWNRGDFSTGGAMITESVTLKTTRITNGSSTFWEDLNKSAFLWGSKNTQKASGITQ